QGLAWFPRGGNLRELRTSRGRMSEHGVALASPDVCGRGPGMRIGLATDIHDHVEPFARPSMSFLPWQFTVHVVVDGPPQTLFLAAPCFLAKTKGVAPRLTSVVGAEDQQRDIA